MKAKMGKPENFADYLADYPKSTQKLLKQVRALIVAEAPKATEIISYGMPAFKLHKMLVWFAGYEHHIGFYPGSSCIAAFKNQITKYKSAKGSVQFPLDEPLPEKLISKMVKFRVKENLDKAALIKKK